MSELEAEMDELEDEAHAILAHPNMTNFDRWRAMDARSYRRVVSQRIGGNQLWVGGILPRSPQVVAGSRSI